MEAGTCTRELVIEVPADTVERETENPARSEHTAGPFRGDRCLAERMCEHRGARGALGEAAKLQQPEIGIRCVGQPPEHNGEELLHHP